MARNNRSERRADRTKERQKKREKAPRPSPVLAGLRSRTGLAIMAIALGATALGYKKCSAPEPPGVAAPPPEQEKLNTFIIDGITITSESVSQDTFRRAYEKAQRVVGQRYWKPTELSVEYGDAAQDTLEKPYDVPGSSLHISHTSEDLRSIIAAPDSLAHELVHFLLGPAGKRLPLALEEIIASAAEDKAEQFEDSDLDAEWVQMPSLDSFYNASPLMTPRYAALRAVAKQCEDRMPEIIAAALKKNNFTFEELPAFFKDFGIDHHILHIGKTGEQHGFVPFTQGGQRGYLYVRYKREEGNATEFPWDGPIKVQFMDEQGAIHQVGQYPMQGTIFITKLPAHFKEVMIVHPDGNFTARGDR